MGCSHGSTVRVKKRETLKATSSTYESAHAPSAKEIFNNEEHTDLEFKKEIENKFDTLKSFINNPTAYEDFIKFLNLETEWTDSGALKEWIQKFDCKSSSEIKSLKKRSKRINSRRSCDLPFSPTTSDWETNRDDVLLQFQRVINDMVIMSVALNCPDYVANSVIMRKEKSCNNLPNLSDESKRNSRRSSSLPSSNHLSDEAHTKRHSLPMQSYPSSNNLKDESQRNSQKLLRILSSSNLKDECNRSAKLPSRPSSGNFKDDVHQVRYNSVKLNSAISSGMLKIVDKAVSALDPSERSTFLQSNYLLCMLVALEQLPVSVFLASNASNGSHLIYANPAFEEVTMLGRHDILGIKVSALSGPPPANPETSRETVTSRESLVSLLSVLHESRSAIMPLINYKSSVVAFNSLLGLKPLRNEVGECLYMVGVQIDLSISSPQPYTFGLLKDLMSKIPGHVPNSDFNRISPYSSESDFIRGSFDRSSHNRDAIRFSLNTYEF